MATAQQTFARQLRKYYAFYTGGFILFVVLLAIAEQMGLPRRYIGYTFLLATIALYAGIGIMSRTADIAEYYVAGRKVPAFFNGMATGADWMSAASFIGMAGTVYAMGFDGLAFIMGWTGGYVLVALLLAPYLRKFGQFTIPDFLGARYEGNLPRAIGIIAAILASFVYVVAQIYGVGIITSRFTGVEFGIGVFLGLAGILVCSFLGGMRAVTWTQVAQYIILIIAYLIPVVWLSLMLTNNPFPQLAYGQVLQKLTVREKELTEDPKEIEVRNLFRQRAEALDAKIQGLPASFEQERAALEKKLADLTAVGAPEDQIKAAKAALDAFPKTPEEAKAVWTAQKAAALGKSAPPKPHATPFPGKDEKAREIARKNFLALVFCLMIGTAALPHILMRYYTTPSVSEARKSVFWSLFFIFLLYFTAPALAVLVKYEVYTNLVGSSIAQLPRWVELWSQVDKTLLSVTDINGDGILQLPELTLGQDIIVLATPEISGLPYVISGLVAAGGLAAALSTADGLLLTIANALSHDLYYKMLDPGASTQRRVAISKGLLLGVAVIAAYVTSLKPGNILFLVGAAFSLAASAFFPALVLGIFWKRATKWGAVAGMVIGLGICFWYMVTRYPFFGINAPRIWDIDPISSGIFGVPAGFLTIVVVSLLTPAPAKQTQELVEHVRYPHLRGDIETRAT
ncbi:MAG TPA: VC_2705 family sodium/solute symporter [Burkholderiales bacterium]|nr:VC_2705 family sodium/solute symporter [Burkholderiales bacterium]